MVEMCKHTLHYLLKQHDNNSYAGIVLELNSLVVHANTKEQIKSELERGALAFFKIYDDVHDRALKDELKPIMHKSSLGTPLAIEQITVECPPNA